MHLLRWHYALMVVHAFCHSPARLSYRCHLWWSLFWLAAAVTNSSIYVISYCYSLHWILLFRFVFLLHIFLFVDDSLPFIWLFSVTEKNYVFFSLFIICFSFFHCSFEMVTDFGLTSNLFWCSYDFHQFQNQKFNSLNWFQWNLDRMHFFPRKLWETEHSWPIEIAIHMLDCHLLNEQQCSLNVFVLQSVNLNTSFVFINNIMVWFISKKFASQRVWLFSLLDGIQSQTNYIIS